MPRLDLAEVKSAASGRWDLLLSSLAPDLHPALQRPGKHVDCPNHGGKNDFRLFKDYNETGGGICTCHTSSDGFSLLMWVNGWDFKTCLYAVAKQLGFDTTGTKKDYRPRLPDPAESDRRNQDRLEEQTKEDEKSKATLNRIWQESLPGNEPDAEPMRLYLVRRGLAARGIPPTLRFHPNLPYAEDGKITGYWPAMIALVQAPDGQAITLHRTYLTYEGHKAPVESPKKLMAYPSDRKLKGAVIRLGAAESVLGVTEGIETGLAIQQSTNMPVWVSVSAILMEQMEVPKSIEMVCVYADKDRSETGRNSAAVLVQRMWEQGKQATGLIPTHVIPDAHKGIDWLDVFNQVGPSSIPNSRRVKELLYRADQAKRKRAR